MSYRKTVVSARRDQKKGRATGGLTEEQKQVCTWSTCLPCCRQLQPAPLCLVKAHHDVRVSWLQEIREAFDLFDTDGSGTIDAKVRCPSRGLLS